MAGKRGAQKPAEAGDSTAKNQDASTTAKRGTQREGSPRRRVEFRLDDNDSRPTASSSRNPLDTAPALRLDDHGATEQLLRETRASHSPSPRRADFKGKQPPKPYAGATYPINMDADMQPMQSIHKPPPSTPQQQKELDDDNWVCTELLALRAQIKLFCEDHFDFQIKYPVEPAFAAAPRELISYVGCVALGGSKGREGWRELIDNIVLRRALVYGIIYRVAHEHIFSSLFFGADRRLIFRLMRLEQDQMDMDGFYRAAQRAKAIQEAGVPKTDLTPLPGAIVGTARLTAQLETILNPIRDLDDTVRIARIDAAYIEGLRSILLHAVRINNYMRKLDDVLYYFQPIFKDEEFDPNEMECENLRDMQLDCPLDDPTEAAVAAAMGKQPRRTKKIRGDPTDRVLVRVICSPGCIAYRKGGGDLAKYILQQERLHQDQFLPPELRSRFAREKVYGRVITEEDGLRSRRLTRATAAFRWGKPQFEDDAHMHNYQELVEAQSEISKFCESTELQKGASGCIIM
ncbi:hypothetical protein AAFC00_003512 [Neodothiora populina]|uniref:Uncharacterized protein n=1 Tax=Neodothiora populina TaxID=2781224 RepID=A0ABR3PEH3_9PEZI